MSRDGCVALPHGSMGLSAVCYCGISWSYSLAILVQKHEKIFYLKTQGLEHLYLVCSIIYWTSAKVVKIMTPGP